MSCLVRKAVLALRDAPWKMYVLSRPSCTCVWLGVQSVRSSMVSRAFFRTRYTNADGTRTLICLIQLPMTESGHRIKVVAHTPAGSLETGGVRRRGRVSTVPKRVERAIACNVQCWVRADAQGIAQHERNHLQGLPQAHFVCGATQAKRPGCQARARCRLARLACQVERTGEDAAARQRRHGLHGRMRERVRVEARPRVERPKIDRLGLFRRRLLLRGGTPRASNANESACGAHARAGDPEDVPFINFTSWATSQPRPLRW